jgi:hypothetical protein
LFSVIDKEEKKKKIFIDFIKERDGRGTKQF